MLLHIIDRSRFFFIVRSYMRDGIMRLFFPFATDGERLTIDLFARLCIDPHQPVFIGCVRRDEHLPDQFEFILFRHGIPKQFSLDQLRVHTQTTKLILIAIRRNRQRNRQLGGWGFEKTQCVSNGIDGRNRWLLACSTQDPIELGPSLSGQ